MPRKAKESPAPKVMQTKLVSSTFVFIGNVKHNGTRHEKDSMFHGSEADRQYLLEQGLLKEVVISEEPVADVLDDENPPAEE